MRFYCWYLLASKPLVYLKWMVDWPIKHVTTCFWVQVECLKTSNRLPAHPVLGTLQLVTEFPRLTEPNQQCGPCWQKPCKAMKNKSNTNTTATTTAAARTTTTTTTPPQQQQQQEQQQQQQHQHHRHNNSSSKNNNNNNNTATTTAAARRRRRRTTTTTTTLSPHMNIHMNNNIHASAYYRYDFIATRIWAVLLFAG